MLKSSTQVDKIVCPFRILENLGVGVGVVYKVEGTLLRCFAALKSLPNDVQLVPFDGRTHELSPKQGSPGLFDPASMSLGLHHLWAS